MDQSQRAVSGNTFSKAVFGLAAGSELAGTPDDARLLGRRGKGGVRFSFILKRLLRVSTSASHRHRVGWESDAPGEGA